MLGEGIQRIYADRKCSDGTTIDSGETQTQDVQAFHLIGLLIRALQLRDRFRSNKPELSVAGGFKGLLRWPESPASSYRRTDDRRGLAPTRTSQDGQKGIRPFEGRSFYTCTFS